MAEPRLDQRAADTFSLRLRQDRYRPERVPAWLAVRELRGREGDVTDNLRLALRHERQGEISVGAQRIDDRRLIAAPLAADDPAAHSIRCPARSRFVAR